MHGIAEAVRTIRKRSGKNQTYFAGMLGCDQSTVSLYELGKSSPSAAVLLRLHDIAHDLGMKSEMGVVDRELDRWLDENASTQEAGLIRKLRESQALRAPKREERQRPHKPEKNLAAAMLLLENTVHPLDDSIVDIAALWNQYGAKPEAVQYFRDAATLLKIQLRRMDAKK